MSSILIPNDPRGSFHTQTFRDINPSWVGPNPFGNSGFYVGFECGRLAFTDEQFRFIETEVRAAASGEAINGVAQSLLWLAISTRADVTFIGPGESADDPLQRVVFDGGALDVKATPSGYFVAPLGRGSIMFVKAGSRRDDSVSISETDREGLNICRVLPLDAGDGTDLILCAGRRAGIGYARFNRGVSCDALNTVRFDGLDVVDLCQLAPDTAPLAVMALGRDGTLVFLRDLPNKQTPLPLKFQSVVGGAYRVLSTHRDVYVLTSKGLFVIRGLAERLMKGEDFGTFVAEIHHYHIQASDINLAGGKWLLAVGDKEVLRFDTDLLPRGEHANGDARQEQPQAVHTPSRREEAIFTQSHAAMAATA